MTRGAHSRLDTAEKILKKVQLVDGCWLWKGTKTRDGYGKINGKSAHRLIYTRLRAAIPDGLQLDHLCGNPACINPEHLEPVTRAENMKRTKKANSPTCIHGHAYTVENTYIYKGYRNCRACNRVNVRRYQQKNGIRGMKP